MKTLRLHDNTELPTYDAIMIGQSPSILDISTPDFSTPK